MSKRIKGWKIDGLFSQFVFCLFIALVIMVLVYGERIYKNIIDISMDGYDEQICLSYIWTKIKNGDLDGQVYIDNFYGITALCLDEKYEDTEYQTAIYFYDGWVREIYYEKGYEFEPEDGAKIIEAELLNFEQLENGLIKTSVNSKSLLISPRTERKLINERKTFFD